MAGAEKQFMGTFTGSKVITITAADGYKKISLFAGVNNSADISIVGETGLINGNNTSAITLSKGEAITFGNGQNDINHLVITINAGAILKFVGTAYQQI
jgi:hypothetical protein